MTTSASSRSGPSAVDRFLNAVTDGSGIPVEVYAPDAALDATVPNWRLHRYGPEAIAAEYSSWFGHPGRFEELVRRPTAEGEVVSYLLTWVEEGVPHAAHHCHLLTFDPEDRILSDTVFCGGRWPADLLAQMAEASA
jgi:hypothetical protein